MKTKIKLAAFLVVLLTVFAFTLLPPILRELHRYWHWIPAPGFLNCGWVEEMEIIVRDERILVSDSELAKRLFGSLSRDQSPPVNIRRMRVVNFKPYSLGPNEWPWSPFQQWSSPEEALRSGYDHRFEIILRGRRGRTLTLVLTNVGADPDKLRDVFLFALETEQIILTWGWLDFLKYLYYVEGMPVEFPEWYQDFRDGLNTYQ